MQLSLWVTLLAACFVISFTPGAGAINTMGNSLNEGFRRSIWGILGQQAALIVHILVVAAGLGVLVAGSPVAFEIIRYSGAAYLVYLGIRQLLAKPQQPAADGGDGTEASTDEGDGETDDARPAPNAGAESRWSMFRRGLWVNLLNPKAIVFFLAFLPQFIRPELPLLPQYLIVGLTVVVVDVIVMWGFFAVAAHSLRRFTRSVRGQRVLNVVFGTLFIAVGVLLAVVH
ncbi:homoserine/homoserine lactone efflux protein [Agromyces hippuratus]|uniref:Homoserine/homoserine lactone efflux protein n=1 Tax=Agromyces hippuratus TaxID=286438 RepID=A0A852WXQ1_9MICO|nr:LysE family transporter [Agromyces hippuratus]NYG22729.1 homoserine/homoserine lactone efflux protein [Agromyces hippuratus]